MKRPFTQVEIFSLAIDCVKDCCASLCKTCSQELLLQNSRSMEA